MVLIQFRGDDYETDHASGKTRPGFILLGLTMDGPRLPSTSVSREIRGRLVGGRMVCGVGQRLGSVVPKLLSGTEVDFRPGVNLTPGLLIS